MKPVCPFCHSDRIDIFEVEDAQWSVACRVCKATGPIGADALAAFDRWAAGSLTKSFLLDDAEDLIPRLF